MRGEQLTADHDVTQLNFLLVDADAARPAGISSTDEEHLQALDVAQDIWEALLGEGWPAPFLADSGNGAHLLYRIRLPPSDSPVLQKCLATLGARFDTAAVTIDQTVFNPSRIWKLYGTMAGKGDNTPERPHRRSSLLAIPDLYDTFVTREQLEALAATAPISKIPHTTYAKPYTRQTFDLDSFITRNNLELRPERPYQGGRKWEFKVCPWNEDHNRGEAYIIQSSNGAISAGCHHSSCQSKGWRDLRTMYEPNVYQGRGAAALIKGQLDYRGVRKAPGPSNQS